MAKNSLIISDQKNIIFDFDLTIVKLDIDWTDWHEGISRVYSTFDINHSYYIGLNPHIFYNDMVMKHGEALVFEVRKFNSEYEEKNVKGFTPSKSLIRIITGLNNKNLYIFTSNSRKTVQKGLEELKIDKLFQQIVSRDETNYLKPNPEGFSLIESFNNNHKDFLMVGDSSSDEKAAMTAGISFYMWTEFETYKF